MLISRALIITATLVSVDLGFASGLPMAYVGNGTFSTRLEIPLMNDKNYRLTITISVPDELRCFYAIDREIAIWIHGFTTFTPVHTILAAFWLIWGVAIEGLVFVYVIGFLRRKKSRL